MVAHAYVVYCVRVYRIVCCVCCAFVFISLISECRARFVVPNLREVVKIIRSCSSWFLRTRLQLVSPSCSLVVRVSLAINQLLN